MAWAYFDTSALLKRYHRERGSEIVDELWEDASSSLVISRLAVVELHSAVSRRIRAGDLNAEDGSRIARRFMADVQQRAIYIAAMSNGSYRAARSLLTRYGARHRLRTLDAIQLGVANELSRIGRADLFVAADLDLAQVAELEGFQVVNPEIPR